MKREILFRGKGVHSEEWVYGDLIHGVGERHGMISILPITKNLAGIPYCDPLDGVYVDTETVGQFTGLTDKNGAKIYEGDILRGTSANPFSLGDVNNYEVMWGMDSWHIYRTFFSLQELFNYCNNEVEVIGNIHDNPELLK